MDRKDPECIIAEIKHAADRAVIKLLVGRIKITAAEKSIAAIGVVIQLDHDTGTRFIGADDCAKKSGMRANGRDGAFLSTAGWRSASTGAGNTDSLLCESGNRRIVSYC